MTALTQYWLFLVCFMPSAFKEPKGFRNDELDLKTADSTLMHRNFWLNGTSRSHKDV